jgi:hypothetical protein
VQDEQPPFVSSELGVGERLVGVDRTVLDDALLEEQP